MEKLHLNQREKIMILFSFEQETLGNTYLHIKRIEIIITVPATSKTAITSDFRKQS